MKSCQEMTANVSVRIYEGKKGQTQSTDEWHIHSDETGQITLQLKISRVHGCELLQQR